MDKKEILKHYIQAVLWTEELEGSNKQIHPVSLQSAQKDIDAFVEQAGDLLSGMEPSQVGHDFWLTRNHHGVGFWDRGLGDVGEKLTKIAHKFNERNVFDDDSLIVIE